MLDITFISQLKKNGKNVNRDFFCNVLKRAAFIANVGKRQIGVSVILVGKAKIRSLNYRYLKKNRATDVLSFPTDTKMGQDDIIELGDIFICYPMAEKNAFEDKISIEAALAFLAIHGFLHLLGYDHTSPARQKKMFLLQNKMLSNKFCPHNRRQIK